MNIPSSALLLPMLTISLSSMAQVQSTASDNNEIPSAQMTPAADSASPIRSIELDVGGESLSNGYGNWRNETLLGAYQVEQQLLQVELSRKEEFHTQGTFAALADTITLGPDWFTRVSIGAGDGAFYLPRIRSDLSLSKKWLEGRNLVTTIGAGFYEAPDGHIDRNLNLGATYYFSTPWIIEGGVRFNRSNPGSISTQQQFLAVTYGQEKHDVLTLRYGWGTEGYQEIAQNQSLVDFRSHEASLGWRHWLTNSVGLLVKVDDYSNPYYQRKGINVGIFAQF